MRIPVLFSMAMLLSPSGLRAQSPIASSIAIAPTVAPRDEYIRSGLGPQKVTAVTADGRFWALAYWIDRTVPLHECRLYVSSDGARSWRLATKARVLEGCDGSLVAGPDGTTLHLAWMGRQRTGVAYDWSIYHGRFDTVSMQWVGQDTILWQATGTGASQYECFSNPDLAIDRKGEILVVAARNSGWTSFFRVFDGQAWSAETQLHAATSMSVRAQVLVGPDDCFHFAYRSGSGSQYDSYYRRYDPAAKAFGAEGQILVKARTNNDQILAMNPGGDLFVGYCVDGALELGHARLGSWQFSNHVVDQDGTVLSGNTSYFCLRVGRAAGGRSVVYYTLPQENRKAIYAREWTGSGLGPRSVAAAGPPNAEFWYHDARADAGDGQGLQLVWSMKLNDGNSPPNQLSWVLAGLTEPAAAVPYGPGCPGSNGRTPWLDAADAPWIGNGGFALALAGALPGAAGAALLGASRSAFGPIPLPLDLSFAGLPGCHLRTSILLALGALAGSGGAVAFPLPIPNDPALAGAALTAQWLLVDGAAAGGIRLSGAVALVPW